MRLVLDTNVVVSGLLWGGAPAQLLDAAQVGEIELFTSRPLLAELSNILIRSKFAKAIAAHADLIVSGDKHLQSWGGQYKGITIIRPAEATRMIEAK